MDYQVFTGEFIGNARPLLLLVDGEKLFSCVRVNSLIRALSEEERACVSRLGNERIRRRHIASRAVLRLLMYTSTGGPPPKKLFTDEGPPLKIPGKDGTPLCFSISHSRYKTLIGLSRGRQLGVDIEAVRPIKDLQRLVSFAFSDEESRWFEGLPLSHSLPAFFRLWTRKEAVVKYYRGTIAGDMHRFNAPLDVRPGTHTVTPQLYGDTGALQLIDFEIPGQIFGALCWEGKLTGIEVLQIDNGWIKGLLPGFLKSCG